MVFLHSGSWKNFAVSICCPYMDKTLNRIFDPLREKYVKLTPEEAVRQLFIRFLTGQRGYPQSHIASEYVFELNGMQRRADIVVFNKELKPVLIVECKAQNVQLEKPEIARETMEQALRYNSVLGVKVLVITNARNTFALKFKSGNGNGNENEKGNRNANGSKYEFLKELPSYEELCA